MANISTAHHVEVPPAATTKTFDSTAVPSVDSTAVPPVDFDDYPLENDIAVGSDDDNFEMDGEYLAGRSSMDIGPGYSPVIPVVSSSNDYKSSKKIKNEFVDPSSNRMTFIPLGSKKEPVIIPKTDKVNRQ